MGKMGINNEKDVIGSGEVAEMLHRPRRTVSKWVSEGKLPTLPPHYAGIHARFSRKQIEQEMTKLSSLGNSLLERRKTGHRKSDYDQVDVNVEISPDQGQLFDIAIPANSVWIHSIQIIPAESNIQFEFLLWDRQQKADYDQKMEDLIYQSESNGQRIIYQPANLYLYEDRNNSKLLHCGIAAFERNIRFDLTKKDLQTYLAKKLKFNIRYIFKLP